MDAAAADARKTTQGQMQHLYQDSLVSQRSELMLVEGMEIREALQEKVRLPSLHLLVFPPPPARHTISSIEYPCVGFLPQL